MSVDMSGGMKANSKCSKGVSFKGNLERVRDPIRSSCTGSIGKGLLKLSSFKTLGVGGADDAGDPTSLVWEDIKLSSSL